MSPSQKSVLWCPTPQLVSLEELAREVARLQGQPAGKEVDSETSEENGPLHVPKSARVVSGRTTPPFAHAGRSPDVSSYSEKHAFRLVGNVEVNDVRHAYSNGCFVQGVLHHHGSQLLAAVMHRWPSFSRFGSRKLPRFHQYLMKLRQLTRRNYSTAHPSQTSPCGSVHPFLAGGASGVEKGFRPTACAATPVLVGRDRSFRDWSAYHDEGLRWVGPRETALASLSQQAPGHVPNASQWGQHIDLSPAPTPRQAKTLTQRPEVLLTRQLQVHQLTSG